jgi:putative hydrolase of the HAD superfamily
MGGSLTVDALRPFLTSGFRWHNAAVTYLPPTPPEIWWRELEPVFERAFREGGGLAQADACRLAREVRGAYVRPARWQLFADVRETLVALTGAGWQHILLTNHVPELRTILRALELDGYFAAVFNSAETGIEKPHREAFENVRRSLPPQTNLWMVGDSFVADIQGAEAAGIPAILVRRAHPSARRFSADLAGVIPLLVPSDSISIDRGYPNL